MNIQKIQQYKSAADQPDGQASEQAQPLQPAVLLSEKRQKWWSSIGLAETFGRDSENARKRRLDQEDKK